LVVVRRKNVTKSVLRSAIGTVDVCVEFHCESKQTIGELPSGI
jgi:hypothetical protein